MIPHKGRKKNTEVQLDLTCSILQLLAFVEMSRVYIFQNILKRSQQGVC